MDYVKLRESYRKSEERRTGEAASKGDWDAIEGDDLRGDDLKNFCKTFINASRESWKNNTSVYICFAMKNVHHLIAAVDELNLNYAIPLIWNKDRINISWNRYHPDYEVIVYGGPGSVPTGPKSRWHGPNNERCVWTITNVTKGYVHPTQKPVELVERALRNSTAAEEIVLDQFGGSGTTLIAAHKTNRRAVILEKDASYCSTIIKRWEEYTGLQAVKGS